MAVCSTSVCVSILLVPLWEITFPAVCTHIFIAIRHDIISPGPEQSYLPGRSYPSEHPALPCSHPCLLCLCTACPDNSFAPWPLHTQNHGATRGNGDANAPLSIHCRSVRVCYCYCIRMRMLRGMMLSRKRQSTKLL